MSSLSVGQENDGGGGDERGGSNCGYPNSSPDAVQVIALLRLSVPWERAGGGDPSGLRPERGLEPWNPTLEP